MNLDQFVAKYLGKMIDFDGHYAGQCVDLFRQYTQDVLKFPQPRGVSGAADFWTNYETDPALKSNYNKITNTPAGVPQKGDVMFWNKKAGGGFGHVSVFLEGNDKEFTSFDQNWPTLSVCTKTKHNYTNVLGWMRPISVIIPPTVETITDKTKINLGGEWGEMEVQAIRSTLSDMRRDTTNAKAELESTIFILESERQRIIKLEENNRELFLALEARIKQVSEMGEENDALKKENEELKSGSLPEPLFRIGRLVVYFSRV